MDEEVPDRETAEAVTKQYADEECIGEFGEIIDARRESDTWTVEFRTHTFSDAYTHQIRITASVGNVISHERDSRFDDED